MVVLHATGKAIQHSSRELKNDDELDSSTLVTLDIHSGMLLVEDNSGYQYSYVSGVSLVVIVVEAVVAPAEVVVLSVVVSAEVVSVVKIELEVAVVVELTES